MSIGDVPRRTPFTLVMGLALIIALVLTLTLSPSTYAAEWAGSDPSANFTFSIPSACWVDGTSVACTNASLALLNAARASLAQPSYELPSGFASLTAAQQGFVLADLDRVLYGLPAVPGITGELSSEAMAGVLADADPEPSGSGASAWTANWAGGYPNILLAYIGWMYDDGPGSANLDCTAAHPSGCWGHRHDILFQFDGSGALAMGVAAGTDPSGNPGYAMLLTQSDAAPTYTYTWTQAVAAGADGGPATPPPTTTTAPGASTNPTSTTPKAPSTPTSTTPGTPGTTTGPGSPISLTTPTPTPAPAPRMTVTLSPIARHGHTITFTVNVTSGHGSVRAVAVSGHRRVTIAIHRSSGGVLVARGTLPAGDWTLTVTCSTAPGAATAAASRARPIRIS